MGRFVFLIIVGLFVCCFSLSSVRDVCLFPVMNGVSGSARNPTMIAQALLGVSVDGIWGPKTTDALVVFEKKHGLNQDHLLLNTAWNALVTLAENQTPSNHSSSLLFAVQKVLNSLQGCSIQESTWGDATINCLKAFQTQRRAEVKTGKLLDYQSLHLLIR